MSQWVCLVNFICTIFDYLKVLLAFLKLNCVLRQFNMLECANIVCKFQLEVECHAGITYCTVTESPPHIFEEPGVTVREDMGISL